MKILVATEKPFAPVAIDQMRQVVEQAGHQWAVIEAYKEKKQLLDAVADADALIIRSDKVDAEVLQAAQQLKIVVRAGAGYDNVDLETAKLRQVVVENTPGQNANAVAELVFGMLIMAARHRYSGAAGTELMGKRIGLLAMGNVGRNVVRLAKGFGMDVAVYDKRRSPEILQAAGVHPVSSLAELFEQSQIVSLHMPANKETIKSIGSDLVRRMPKGGVLVNTARKEVIREDELLATLQERTDLSYLTDLKPEADAEFQKLGERYFTTPKKMGAQTAEANIKAGVAAAKQVVAFFDSGDTTFQVNK